MVLFYDPEIYGWSKMSKALQALCRKTVFHNIRDDYVLYVNGVPMHTTNTQLDVTELMGWTLQHQPHFGNDFKMLVAIKDPHHGIHLPVLSFTFRGGKWTLLSHTQMREAFIPDRPPRDPSLAQFVTQMGRLTVGKTGYLKQQRRNSRYATYDQAIRLSSDSYVVVTEIHPGISAARPDVAALLRTKLTGQALPLAMLVMLNSTCAAEYDVVRSDREIAMLPVDALTDEDMVSLHISTSDREQKKKKDKKKKGKAQATSSRKPQKTVFVNPPKSSVVRMTLGEALDMLAVDGRTADYHNVCPKRTSRTIAGSYRPELQCTKTMRTAECRHRRDKALACAILRQRKQIDVADYDMAHQVPISLAYALASGCARQVASSASATNQNRRFDNWLPLKTAVVLPQHQQFLPKSSRRGQHF